MTEGDGAAAYLRARIRVGKRGCWLWQGNLHESGHPRAWYGGKTVFAHRLAWRVFRGPIPRGRLLSQTCRNRRCINPDHLFLSTPRQVAARIRERGSWNGINSKITTADVRRIRRLYDRGKLNTEEIAARFGITSSNVIRIGRRQRWRHVKD